MSILLSEARLALRSLLRQPGFLAVAILTLALGVGAVSAIFSVVNGVLLRPLPYPDSERIIRINRVQPPFSGPVSLQLLADWRQATRNEFAVLGAFTPTVASLSGSGEAERLAGYRVTPEFWPVMGLAPAVGRWFTDEEEASNERVVVLSHALWQRRFGGDAGIVGRDIVLDGVPHRVLGVTPSVFRYPGSTDIYLPTHLPSATNSRGNSFLSPIGRLSPGASIEQAEAALAVINPQLAEQYPDNHANLSAKLTPLPVLLNSAVREPLLILLAASALVLLIACANLANLLLARGSQRRRELAVRAALGAGRGLLLRVVMVEALVIALAGGLLGVALAAIGVPLLLAGAPTLMPSHSSPGVDGTVVAISLAVAVLTVTAFALLPALRAARVQPAGALQEEGRSGSGGRTRARARSALVAVEVALSLTLLVGAGLLIESLRRVGEVDVGLRADGVLTASIVLTPPPAEPGETVEAMFGRVIAYNNSRLPMLLERLRALPGVQAATIVEALPGANDNSVNSSITFVGRDTPEGSEMPWANWRFAEPGILDTLGLRLVRGRMLEPGDHPTDGMPTAILVNEEFVRRWFGELDPIGQQIGNLLEGEPKTIVGVVSDVRVFGRESNVQPDAYMPLSAAFFNQFVIALRTQGDPLAVAEPLRRSMQAFDPTIPLLQVRTLADLLDTGSQMRRFNMQLMLVFSVVALLLAALGLYAVIAYGVAQRRQEFGIRMSLGADARRVVALVVGGGMRLVAVGLLLGLAGAYLLGRTLSSQLYGVGAADPGVILAVTAVLALVAFAACAVPALRAARTAPMVALQQA